MVARKSFGYTLIELLIVLGILGLLASLAMPMAEITVQREKERELKRALWQIRDALDDYQHAIEVGALTLAPGSPPCPLTLQELTTMIPDARPNHKGEYMRFLRNVPRDPFSDGTLPPEKTWGIRGFYSEATDPKPIGGVYDVFSQSKLIGLNGVPLSQW